MWADYSTDRLKRKAASGQQQSLRKKLHTPNPVESRVLGDKGTQHG
jgi:hypothetical protein